MKETDYTLLSDWHIIWMTHEYHKAEQEYCRRLMKDPDGFKATLEDYYKIKEEVKQYEISKTDQ